MSDTHGQGPPRSTTADVMAAIIAYYAAVNDPTAFYVGDKYTGQEGATQRIVLVRGGGEFGAPDRIGAGNYIGHVDQRFTAYLWGAEDTNLSDPQQTRDLRRYAAVEAMADRYLNALRAIIPGRCKMKTLNPATETNIVTFGEELQIVATYYRNVPTDAAIARVAVTPISPPDPMRPNGDEGTTFGFEPTTSGSR